jgi:hypothetical protein
MLLLLQAAAAAAAAAAVPDSGGRNAEERAYVKNLDRAIDTLGIWMLQHTASMILPEYRRARRSRLQQSAGEGTDKVAAAARVCGQICALTENQVRLLLALESTGHSLGPYDRITSVLPQMLQSAAEQEAAAAAEGKGFEPGPGALWEPILAAGPGSKQQRLQLLGLCCSALKVCNGSFETSHTSNSMQRQLEDRLGWRLQRAVCRTATQVLKAATGETDTTPFVLRQLRPGHYTTGPITVTNAGSSVSTDGIKAVQLLAWFALIGRCFMLWAMELQGFLALGFGTTPPGLPVAPPVISASEAAAAKQAEVEMFQGFRDAVVGAAVSIREVLDYGDYAKVLTAAGYDIPAIQRRASQEIIPAVIKALQVLDAASADSAPVGHVLETVCSVLGGNGLSYVSLATSNACNNPSCSNVSGPSELELVVGKSCR